MAELKVSKDCIYNASERAKLSVSSWSSSVFIFAAMQFGGVFIGRDTVVEKWLAGLLIASLTMGIIFWVKQRSVRSMAKFGSTLRPKMEEKYGRDLEGFVHVGFAPGLESKSYDGDDSWDVGYLRVEESLEYLGDQCAFEITGNHLLGTKMKLRSKMCWDPRLLVEYQVPGEFKSRWISIEVRGASSPTEQYVLLEQLRTRINLLGKVEPVRSLALPPVPA